jgi:hypothetical protein
VIHILLSLQSSFLAMAAILWLIWLNVKRSLCFKPHLVFPVLDLLGVYPNNCVAGASRSPRGTWGYVGGQHWDATLRLFAQVRRASDALIL